MLENNVCDVTFEIFVIIIRREIMELAKQNEMKKQQNLQDSFSFRNKT